MSQLSFFNDDEQPAVTIHRYDPDVSTPTTITGMLTPRRIAEPGLRILFRDALTDQQLMPIMTYLYHHAPIRPTSKLLNRNNVIVFPAPVAPIGLGEMEDILRTTATAALTLHPATQTTLEDYQQQLSLF